MNNDNNNSIPGIEDALKEFESVKELNKQNTVVQEPVNTPVETPQTPVQGAKYSVNGKNYNSLTEMMEDQERNSPKKEVIHHNEEYYIKYYIGNNYEKYEKGGISFAYFFLGEYYLMYRKMYIPAIIKYLLTLGLLYVAVMFYSNGNFTYVYACLGAISVIQLLPIFIVKRFYYNYAKGKVKKIIEENKDKDKEEITRICSDKGGTSFIFVGALILFYLVVNNFFDVRSVINTLDETSNQEDKLVYEIKIRDLYTKSSSYLGFEEGGFHNQTRIIKNDCTVRINTKYVSEDMEITEYAENAETVYINKHKWDHFRIDDYNEKYIAINGKYLYTIEIVDNKTDPQCESSVNVLTSSLIFK